MGFWTVVFLIVWGILGFIDGGYQYAYHTRRYPDEKKMDKITRGVVKGLCWVSVALGPVGLMFTWMDDEMKYGWKRWF